VVGVQASATVLSLTEDSADYEVLADLHHLWYLRILVRIIRRFHNQQVISTTNYSKTKLNK
jgi:hypothetical protein